MTSCNNAEDVSDHSSQGDDEKFQNESRLPPPPSPSAAAYMGVWHAIHNPSSNLGTTEVFEWEDLLKNCVYMDFYGMEMADKYGKYHDKWYTLNKTKKIVDMEVERLKAENRELKASLEKGQETKNERLCLKLRAMRFKLKLEQSKVASLKRKLEHAKDKKIAAEEKMKRKRLPTSLLASEEDDYETDVSSI